jgi:hypothetical protein
MTIHAVFQEQIYLRVWQRGRERLQNQLLWFVEHVLWHAQV